MIFRSSMNNKEIEKYSDTMELIKAQCSCGRRQTMPVFVHSAICRSCGKKIYNNSKTYFLYQLRKAKEKIDNEKTDNNTDSVINSDSNNK